MQESVNELIKEKITGFAETNRDIITFMLSCIQNYKELYFCLESLFKKKLSLETDIKAKTLEKLKKELK